MQNSESPKRKARIYYARTDEFWRKGEKYAFLEEKQHVGGVEWQELQPDANHNWLTEGFEPEFSLFMPLGNKETKAVKSSKAEAIFHNYSNGVATKRDDVVYGFDRVDLLSRIEVFCDLYNTEVHKYQQKKIGTMRTVSSGLKESSGVRV